VPSAGPGRGRSQRPEQVAGLPLLGFLEQAVARSEAPVAVFDVHGLLDGIVPANVPGGARHLPGVQFSPG
jgi:hypothetical protein